MKRVGGDLVEGEWFGFVLRSFMRRKGIIIILY